MTDTMFPVPTGIDRALHAFLTDWLTWAEAGAPDHPVFFPEAGLCSNARWWGEEHGIGIDMDLAFMDIFGGESYQFGCKAFYERSRNRTQHLDPNRLAWVRAVLAANPESISNTED